MKKSKHYPMICSKCKTTIRFEDLKNKHDWKCPKCKGENFEGKTALSQIWAR